jgi:hypothetical protein
MREEGGYREARRLSRNQKVVIRKIWAGQAYEIASALATLASSKTLSSKLLLQNTA